VSHVQCSVTDLNGVTEKDQINTSYENENYFKYYIKIKTIYNKHYKNKTKKGI